MKIGKCGSPKMVKPVGSLVDELVGAITMHGAIKMVKMVNQWAHWAMG